MGHPGKNSPDRKISHSSKTRKLSGADHGGAQLPGMPKVNKRMSGKNCDKAVTDGPVPGTSGRNLQNKGSNVEVPPTNPVKRVK